jgi:hypothetical protein
MSLTEVLYSACAGAAATVTGAAASLAAAAADRAVVLCVVAGLVSGWRGPDVWHTAGNAEYTACSPRGPRGRG